MVLQRVPIFAIIKLRSNSIHIQQVTQWHWCTLYSPIEWKFERKQLRDTYFAGVPLIGGALFFAKKPALVAKLARLCYTKNAT